MAMVFVHHANAAVVINIVESGGNVQATLSGDINTSALGVMGGNASNTSAFIIPAAGNFATSGVKTTFPVDVAWTPFGTGGSGSWDSTSGDPFAMFSGLFIGLPVSYVSQSALSATATENNSTFATLGFIPGTYVTTLTNGQFSDTVTINIVVAPAQPIPSLSVWGIGILVGLFSILGVRRRRMT
jgi:hypothetical protein